MMRSLWICAAVAALVTALCIVTIDPPIARWLATHETLPAAWNHAVELLEYPLGIQPWKWTGVCVLCAASLATLLVPRLRSYAAVILIVTLTHLLSRNASLWVKTLTGRYRPSQWVEHGGDTFWHTGAFSFPSGHVLLFGSIAVPIAMIYPRTRPILFGLLAFVMVARVVVNQHFLSDVIGGLAVVAAFTALSALLVRRALPSQILPASLR